MNNNELNEMEVDRMEENREQVCCYECGEMVNVEDTQKINGEHVCNHCVENCYYICDDCGEYIREGDGYSVDNGNRFVCESCLDYNYFQCDKCGDYHNNDYMREVYDDHDVHCVCEHCFENSDIYYCDECDRYYYSDFIRYDENSDRYYCDDCYAEYVCNDDNLHVGCYHEHKGTYERNIQRLDSDSENEITYGTETEMEHIESSNENKMALLEALHEFGIPGVFEGDGSLDNSGVEYITYPYTYTWLMENVDKVKTSFEKAIELGYRSDQSSHCGIHIHVARPSDEVIDRVWLILETFKNEIIQVARRHNTDYAHFISDERSVNNDVLKSLYYIKKNKSGDDRYYALNLTNSKTIEFRIFKGTLNYRTWLAYQQFVHNIMVECSNLDKPVQDIMWEDLISGEYISELCEKRNIVCYSRVVDNSKRLEELEAQRNRVIDSVNKELKKYARAIINTCKIDKSKFDSVKELYRRFRNYCDGDLYSANNILSNISELEQCKDSNISIDDYIRKVNNFLDNQMWVNNIHRMSDTIFNKIKELIKIENNTNDEMGGEE